MKRGPGVFTMLAIGAMLLPSSSAQAATEIQMVGSQFVPVVASIAFGDTVTWVNTEPTEYVVAGYEALISKHNLAPDLDTAAALGAKPFPTGSKIIGLGQSWTCTGTASGAQCVTPSNKTVTLTQGLYAYKCGLHPNQMRGLLSIS